MPVEVGRVIVVPSVAVIVAPVATDVNATLLILVAVAAPNEGVDNDGLVASTTLPVPVEPVSVGA